MSIDVEADSLGQGQIFAVIDGDGLSTHVGFPGVGPRLSSATGLFFATEGSTDFSAAGTDVDVGDTAIGAGVGDEEFGFAHIVGHDSGGKALRYGVVDIDGLFDGAVFHQVQDGSEGFGTDDVEGGLDFGDDGFDVQAAFVAGAFEDAAGEDEGSAFVFDALESLEVDFDGLFVDEGAHVVGGVEGIADAYLLVGVYEFFFDLVVDAFVDDESSGGGASLAGGTDGAEDDCAKHEVHICAGGDDDGVVATEFEDDFAEAGFYFRADDLAHADTSRSGDEGDTIVFGYPFADVVIAGDDIDGTFGYVISTQDVGKDVHAGDSAEGCFFGGFPQEDVSAHKGNHGIPRPYGHGKVEGSDDTDDAEGMPTLEHVMHGAFTLNGQSVKLAGETDGEVAHVDHFLYLSHALLEAFAHFVGDELSEGFFVLAQGIAVLTHDFTAFRGRPTTPDFKSFLRTLDHAIVFFACSRRDTADQSAVDGAKGFDVITRV